MTKAQELAKRFDEMEHNEEPTYFMHHATGEVDEEDFWREHEDFEECVEKGYLIEVIRSAEGEWVEA